MSRIKEMINALRKCAKEHENDVVCTGQIVTSSLCRDVADYLEADRWHYPSKGEYPTDSGRFLCAVSYFYETRVEVVHFVAEAEEWGSMNRVIAWMPLPVPPKEEA